MSDATGTETPTPNPEPARPAAKPGSLAWLMLLLVLAAGASTFWWVRHTRSAEYQAKKALAQAGQLARDGELAEAAAIYRGLAAEKTPVAEEATEEFEALLGKRLFEVPLA